MGGSHPPDPGSTPGQGKPYFCLCPYRTYKRALELVNALVAQWIAHQTSNLGVAGSNPVERGFFFC